MPLTPLGELQARAIAALLPATAPAIWSSPFKRALDTAAPYCARLGLAARLQGELREFETVDTVQLRGTTCEEREAVVAGLLDEVGSRPPLRPRRRDLPRVP